MYSFERIAASRVLLLAFAAFVVTFLIAGKAVAESWDDHDLAELLSVAETTAEEGIPVDDRLIDELHALIEGTNGDLTERDEKASAAYQLIASHFAFGATEPRSVDRDWHIIPQRFSFDVLHDFALAQDRVEDTLRALLPHSPQYLALKTALARLEQEKPSLLNEEALEQEERATKLRVNMERWRWLPRVLPTTRIEVNVPSYRLLFVDQDVIVATHDVIVGELDRQTPVFEASVRGVIFNPWWDPPPSLIFGKLLPRFRKDASVPAREGFEVRTADGELTDPSTIDWHAIQSPFPYRLRQRPGPHNALGQVKFDLPNPYSILLHDTPSKGLFERERRALSAGCIRVEDALGFAETLINGTVDWSHDNTTAALAGKDPIRVDLKTPIPVFVTYLTAVADANGEVVYLDDLYGRDTAVASALEHGARTASSATTPYDPTLSECHALS
jgi:murein L,D-transpeptidase YcbB/YkuD